MQSVERTAARELGRSFLPARCTVRVMTVSSPQRFAGEHIMHRSELPIQELINQRGSR